MVDIIGVKAHVSAIPVFKKARISAILVFSMLTPITEVKISKHQYHLGMQQLFSQNKFSSPTIFENHNFHHFLFNLKGHKNYIG